MFGLRRGIIEEIVEWWHHWEPPIEGDVKPVAMWQPSWWWGRRWMVCYDDGMVAYEPYWKYLTHKQMAHRALKRIANVAI